MSWATAAKWGIGALATWFGGKAFGLWGKDSTPVQQPTAQQPQQSYPPQYQQPSMMGYSGMDPMMYYSLFGNMKYANDIFAAPMYQQILGAQQYRTC